MSQMSLTIFADIDRCLEFLSHPLCPFVLQSLINHTILNIGEINICSGYLHTATNKLTKVRLRQSRI